MHARHNAFVRLGLVTLAIGGVIRPLVAAEDLAHAVVRAPAVAAARLRVDAALARRGAAGQLPAPTLEGMLGEKQAPTDDNPMWGLTLQQPLPKLGARAADHRRAEAAADMSRAEWVMLAGRTAAEVAMQLTESDTARRREALINAQRERLQHVLAVVDARVATGQSRAAERLMLDSRLADLQLMTARESQMMQRAERAARAHLGLPDTAPLPAFSAPEPASLDPAQAASVRLAEARGREADAMAGMARAARRPMTALGVRFEREDMRDGNEDTLGVALMTEIPWRNRRYARADLAAATAEIEASLADAEAARLQIASLVSSAESADQLAQTVHRLAGGHAARLEAQYDTLLQNAAIPDTGMGPPVLMLIEILDRRAAVDLQVIEADGVARAAHAALWAHASESAFAITETMP